MGKPVPFALLTPPWRHGSEAGAPQLARPWGEDPTAPRGRGRLSGREGKAHGEGRSAAVVAPGRHRATHGHDQVADDMQAQPDPRRPPHRVLAAPLEGLEDGRPGGQADTLVDDLDLNVAGV